MATLPLVTSAGAVQLKPSRDLAKAGYSMINSLPATSSSSVGSCICNDGLQALKNNRLSRSSLC